MRIVNVQRETQKEREREGENENSDVCSHTVYTVYIYALAHRRPAAQANRCMRKRSLLSLSLSLRVCRYILIQTQDILMAQRAPRLQRVCVCVRGPSSRLEASNVDEVAKVADTDADAVPG